MSTIHEPLHPGEIIKDALFNETSLKTVSEAADKLKISRITLSRLLNGHAGISAGPISYLYYSVLVQKCG